MDIRKYFAITHQNHAICNPTSSAKIDELVALLPLDRGARVLDVACGKAEMLLRIATRHHATGVGVDIAPAEVAAARQRVNERGMQDRLQIIEGDGADYPADANSFDLGCCIGATWVWGGYRGTIQALTEVVVPGGLIAIGEPFKTREPDPEYLAAEPSFVPTLVSHAENVEIAQALGLTMLYAIASSADDWDRYEGLQTLAAESYARSHPDDPDRAELMARRRREDAKHFRWGRTTLGWAIYLFRAPG